MWNATLLCTKVYSSLYDSQNERNFIEGNLYEVREGKLIDGNGNQSHGTYEDLKQIRESFYADFKEVEQ